MYVIVIAAWVACIFVLRKCIQEWLDNLRK